MLVACELPNIWKAPDRLRRSKYSRQSNIFRERNQWIFRLLSVLLAQTPFLSQIWKPNSKIDSAEKRSLTGIDNS